MFVWRVMVILMGWLALGYRAYSGRISLCVLVGEMNTLLFLYVGGYLHTITQVCVYVSIFNVRGMQCTHALVHVVGPTYMVWYA